MTCVNVVKDVKSSWNRKEEIKARGEKWLQINHIKAFYAVTANNKISDGVQSAMDFCGLGKLSPNMLLLGNYNILLKLRPSKNILPKNLD